MSCEGAAIYYMLHVLWLPWLLNLIHMSGFHTGIFVGGGEDLRAEIFLPGTPHFFSHHTLSTKVFLLEPTQEYILNIIPVGE